MAILPYVCILSGGRTVLCVGLILVGLIDSSQLAMTAQHVASRPVLHRLRYNRHVAMISSKKFRWAQKCVSLFTVRVSCFSTGKGLVNNSIFCLSVFGSSIKRSKQEVTMIGLGFCFQQNDLRNTTFDFLPYKEEEENNHIRHNQDQSFSYMVDTFFLSVVM